MTQLKELRDFYASKLFDECLPFWLNNAVDHEYGGFMTALDRDGTVVDTDKSVWHQGRFTWLLGELANDSAFSDRPGRKTWTDTARFGGDFLRKSCFDTADGRMWFHVDRQGYPIRKRRYAFSESFAAIAFGELAQHDQNEEYRTLALQCFDRFLNHDQRADVEPKFTQHRPMQSLGAPMISIVTSQELRSSLEWNPADAVIEEAIGTIEKYFVKPELECVMENVSPSGELVDHFDGRTLNPGHAIEASWFIMEEGRIRQKQSWIDLGCQMFDWMFAKGWDAEYGGLLYFVDVKGLPVQEYWHDMKFWWPHNEALIAALLAYECKRDEKYLEIHQMIHDWCYQHFQDDEFGEWFGYLHRDGRRSVTLKGNLWKGPFHYPRMLLTCIRILDRLLKANESKS